MKALIIGATGKDLLNVLFNDSGYEEVVIFVRRSTGIHHPKLAEVITDFDHLEEVTASIHGDVLFSCLGTTLKAAGSKDRQRHIDYEIPVQFASLARANGEYTGWYYYPPMVLLSGALLSIPGSKVNWKKK